MEIMSQILKQEDKLKNRSKRGPLRWEQSYKLLEIIQANPAIGAQDLQIEGASFGIEIGIRTAFRFIERYRSSEGNIFNNSRTHLQILTGILQAAPAENALSPFDIRELALEQGISLHLSTVYRILHKLVTTGTVVQHTVGTKTLYEWNRGTEPQGQILCIVCGQAIEFKEDFLEGLAQSICSKFDHQYHHLKLTLHAICSHCRQ